MSEYPKGHKWISVAERLPEVGQKVFVCCDNPKHSDPNAPLSLFAVATYHDDGMYRYWQDSTNYQVLRRVICWMPIPPV